MRIPKNHPLSGQKAPEAEPRDLAAERRTVLRQLGIREHIISSGEVGGSSVPPIVTAWFPSRREGSPGRPVTRSLILSLPVVACDAEWGEFFPLLFRITTGRTYSWDRDLLSKLMGRDVAPGAGQAGGERITAHPAAEYVAWDDEEGLVLFAAYDQPCDHVAPPTLVPHDGAELALQDIAQVMGA